MIVYHYFSIMAWFVNHWLYASARTKKHRQREPLPVLHELVLWLSLAATSTIGEHGHILFRNQHLACCDEIIRCCSFLFDYEHLLRGIKVTGLKMVKVDAARNPLTEVIMPIPVDCFVF